MANDPSGRTLKRVLTLVPRSPLAWMLITLIPVMALLTLYPMWALGRGALSSGSPLAADNHLTLDNFDAIVRSRQFWMVLGNTVRLATVVTVVTTVVATTLAFLVTRTDLRFAPALEWATVAAIFTSGFTLILGYGALYRGDVGMLNRLSDTLSLPLAGNADVYSWLGLVTVMTVYMLPFAYLLMVGPLKGIDASFAEAAIAGGASPFRAVLLELNLARPAIVAAAFVVFMLSAEIFSVPGVIGVPIGLHVLSYDIYTSVNAYPAQWGAAGSYGVMLLLLSAVMLGLASRATRKSLRFTTTTGKGVRLTRWRLGRLRWPVTVGYGIVVFLLVALPLAALVAASFLPFPSALTQLSSFNLDNWRSVLGNDRTWQGLRTSLVIAGATALATFVLSYAQAYTAVRWNGHRFARIPYVLGTLPIAIPGVVLGLALVWGYIRTPLYATTLLIWIAYICRFNPFAVQSLHAATTQVPREMEDAARVVGVSRLRAQWDIILPLIKGPTLSAMFLVLILSVQEVNIAIMLQTPGTFTLPTLVWQELETGMYSRAAALSVLQLGIVVAAYGLGRMWLRGDYLRTIRR